MERLQQHRRTMKKQTVINTAHKGDEVTSRQIHAAYKVRGGWRVINDIILNLIKI